ncbi:hypothetical protein C1646_750123 [Rhizophagus diaphanus]|nr:hypothetical protein C1646_750123 [Rhizophagus diaphanus] [Rhizophagus sp. MUCL 43196]
MDVPPDCFVGIGCSDSNNNNFPPCNAANISTYIMNISGTELCNRVPQNQLPVEFAAGFNLDLRKLQIAVQENIMYLNFTRHLN